MMGVEERYEAGKELRKEFPRSTHATFRRRDDIDPTAVLLGQDSGRIESLVPVRHGRMAEDAFAFYRAGAALMAADLGSTTTTGIMVQASGDAHIGNFGFWSGEFMARRRGSP